MVAPSSVRTTRKYCGYHVVKGNYIHAERRHFLVNPLHRALATHHIIPYKKGVNSLSPALKKSESTAVSSTKLLKQSRATMTGDCWSVAATSGGKTFRGRRRPHKYRLRGGAGRDDYERRGSGIDRPSSRRLLESCAQCETRCRKQLRHTCTQHEATSCTSIR